MTKAFVDSASVHGALSALLIGRERLATSPWEQQSLLEVTYLLMHTNVYIIPGGPPNRYFGPSGPFEEVLARFPTLGEPTELDLRKATSNTKTWAKRKVDSLRNAFE